MLLTSAIFILGPLALAALAQLICSRRDARKFRPPGSLIKVPGGQIHVRQAGTGRPAVVLESGIAASSLNWSLLQPRLADCTATYSYDRAGFGWSTSQSKQCSLAKMSDDLHKLVTALELPQPYVLVAHSFGAYIVTAFAQRFPEELAGVVLVDPLTPQEWIKPDREQRWRLLRGVWFSRAGGVLASVGAVRVCLWLLQRGSRKAPRGVLRMFGRTATETVERILRELAKLPPEVVRLIRARWSTPKFFWTMAAYIRALPACAAELEGCAIPAQVPVTVLSGSHQPAVRLDEHAAIAARSQHGQQVLAPKGAHWIHLDQPELVVQAVREMAETYHLECSSEPTLHEEGRRA
jgi:pimeloyl-ACP methyl ester carboxylesterase